MYISYIKVRTIILIYPVYVYIQIILQEHYNEKVFIKKSVRVCSQWKKKRRGEREKKYFVQRRNVYIT